MSVRNVHRAARVAIPVLLLASARGLEAQRIGVDPIDSAAVRHWITDTPQDYSGAYGFGESEAETTMLLIVDEDLMVAQIRAGGFDGPDRWVWHCTLLNEVEIRGTLFHSDRTDGEFVVYTGGRDLVRGLKVVKPSFEYEGGWELGPRTGEAEGYFPGRYPQGSLELLDGTELEGYDASQLRIMRNEIFARYGYVFREGGEMARYFAEQDWYQPGSFDDMDACVTEIDRRNIATIQAVEEQRQ